MHGAFSLAYLKMYRSREAPTPLSCSGTDDADDAHVRRTTASMLRYTKTAAEPQSAAWGLHLGLLEDVPHARGTHSTSYSGP